jgi:hypothetical protein
MTRTFAIILTIALAGPALAQPLPQPKVGTCPPGYRESGGYCAPMSRDAPAAIPKRGQCPSGWASWAHYCTQMRRCTGMGGERWMYRSGF